MSDDHNPPYRRPGSLLYFVDLQQADGEAEAVCLDTADLAEARRIAAELRSARASGPPTTQDPEAAGGFVSPPQAPEPGSVHWALAEHLHRKAADLADATRSMYAGQAGTLVRLLGLQPLAKLTFQDIQGYAEARRAEHVVPETVRKELVLLRAALRTAFYLGHGVPDVLLIFPKLASRYVPRKRWLTAEQFMALLDRLQPRRRSYLYVACYTGARRSELARMRWEDIDWTRGAVHLRGTKTREAARVVPLHPQLAAFLRPQASGPAGAVLEPWPNVCRDLAVACEALGIPRVTPNDLRRTFGSWLVQANCSAHTVAKLLGHTTEKMVNQVYGHLDDHALRRAVALLPAGPEVSP